MTKLTLVTGATGLIGPLVVHRLLAEGTSVRVLVRQPDRLPADLRKQVDMVVGDIRDPGVIARALRGTSTVLHLAACARAWASDPMEFTDVNVRAVRVLLRQAARHRVERMVHVSTVVTLPPYRPAPINGPSQAPTPYEMTKLAGEKLVDQYGAKGHHAVIVHPTRVYGPGPLNDANAVTKAIALYLKGRLLVRLADRDALGNYVHASDVAHGIVLAARHGKHRAHYILGGENASFRGLLHLVAEISGIHHPMVALPPAVALAVARGAELWGRLGRRVPITPGWVRMLLEDRRVSCDSARADLGYAPRPLRAGLEETIDWLTLEHQK